MADGILIVLSGRSGVGKSTIARCLARGINAVWLRIDSIEQAIREAEVLKEGVDEAGYLVARALAGDNLRLGHHVIADCVNDWSISRDAWREVGLREGVGVIEVEIVCSDMDEHRRRVEKRISDVPGLRLPDWSQTMLREYHAWDRAHLVVDTAGRSIEASVEPILASFSRAR